MAAWTFINYKLLYYPLTNIFPSKLLCEVSSIISILKWENRLRKGGWISQGYPDTKWEIENKPFKVPVLFGLDNISLRGLFFSRLSIENSPSFLGRKKNQLLFWVLYQISTWQVGEWFLHTNEQFSDTNNVS